MAQQRDHSGLDQLFAQHDELAEAAQALRGDEGASALDHVLRLLRRHEIAEAPLMEAARSTLQQEMVTEYEERWRTIRELAAGLQESESLPPNQVDQVIGLLYDHTVDVNASVFGLLYLQLSDEQFAEVNREIAESVSSLD